MISLPKLGQLLLATIATFGSMAEAQSPPSSASPAAQVITTVADIYFDFGEALLDHAAQATLRDLSRIAGERPIEIILLEGRTDAIEAASLDPGLASRRVETVKAFLVANGVESALIKVQEPDAVRQSGSSARSGNDAAGRAKQRRVEVEVVPLRRPHRPGEPDV